MLAVEINPGWVSAKNQQESQENEEYDSDIQTPSVRNWRHPGIRKTAARRHHLPEDTCLSPPGPHLPLQIREPCECLSSLPGCGITIPVLRMDQQRQVKSGAPTMATCRGIKTEPSFGFPGLTVLSL